MPKQTLSKIEEQPQLTIHSLGSKGCLTGRRTDRHTDTGR